MLWHFWHMSSRKCDCLPMWGKNGWVRKVACCKSTEFLSSHIFQACIQTALFIEHILCPEVLKQWSWVQTSGHIVVQLVCSKSMCPFLWCYTFYIGAFKCVFHCCSCCWGLTTSYVFLGTAVDTDSKYKHQTHNTNGFIVESWKTMVIAIGGG